MSKKRKILLLSDDLRMYSGIATQSKEFVFGTLHHYDWVQIGAAIKHPDAGKLIDMSEFIKNDQDINVKNPYMKIFPSNGYGDPDMLREIIKVEKPDAILHFTDPRFWIWLYQMEHEIRQNIPIFYYNIWDDLPTPRYNTNYYRSCDLLMSISKQTYGINKRILDDYDYEDWQVKYVPHGINEKKYFKVEKGDSRFIKFEQKHGLDKYKFKILFLNRNIRRKNPGDFVLAYKHFMDSLTEEQRKDCCLVFHTAPSDENGTDIRAVCQRLIPDYDFIFTFDNGELLGDEEMNFIYNSADVYMNLASNEGFGLGSAEALMTETPIIVNVTGGLQDQCGFKELSPGPDAGGWRYLTEDDYVELGSNHRGQYKEHGEWVKPVFPSNISLQGSPMTPYIFDDRAQYEDAGDAIRYWYDKTPKEREKCGRLGKEYMMDKNIGMTAKHMSDNFIKNMDSALEKWKPKEKYTLELV